MKIFGNSQLKICRPLLPPPLLPPNSPPPYEYNIFKFVWILFLTKYFFFFKFFFFIVLKKCAKFLFFCISYGKIKIFEKKKFEQYFAPRRYFFVRGMLNISYWNTEIDVITEYWNNFFYMLSSFLILSLPFLDGLCQTPQRPQNSSQLFYLRYY